MVSYLNDISAGLKGKKCLSQDFVDLCTKSIQESIQNSTSAHFENNPFFQELPPGIKKRLVKSVLHDKIKMFKYFFHDF